jgi:hypothetical protein
MAFGKTLKNMASWTLKLSATACPIQLALNLANAADQKGWGKIVTVRKVIALLHKTAVPKVP